MVKSVQRTLELLQALGSTNKKYTLSELGEVTGLPPSTVHRLLVTLKQHRFVTQDELSSLYYLGPALVTLGIKAGNYIDLRKSAMSIMRNLANTTGEDSYLAISDVYRGIFLERVAGPHPLKIIDPFDKQVSLHCGAMRKVLLAFKDSKFINNFINNDLNKFTEKTISDRDELLEELKRIRKEDVAISIGEYIKDAVGIAAPIRDKHGTVIASLGIIGPMTRFPQDKLEEQILEVKRHGRQLSFDLGYYSI
ncbi:IclR family transcriptional regulator [Wukongibacter baidiensis]|uniref:IclR family transcriptional regulator n=1 Tax=Wukongibacter baidiensis TaxID=1723361 RepID=UPI003D7FCD9C